MSLNLRLNILTVGVFRQVFTKMTDEQGRPYSADEYRLEVSPVGVVLVRRGASEVEEASITTQGAGLVSTPRQSTSQAQAKSRQAGAIHADSTASRLSQGGVIQSELASRVKQFADLASVGRQGAQQASVSAPGVQVKQEPISAEPAFIQVKQEPDQPQRAPPVALGKAPQMPITGKAFLERPAQVFPGRVQTVQVKIDASQAETASQRPLVSVNRPTTAAAFPSRVQTVLVTRGVTYATPLFLDSSSTSQSLQAPGTKNTHPGRDAPSGHQYAHASNTATSPATRILHPRKRTLSLRLVESPPSKTQEIIRSSTQGADPGKS